MSATNKETRKQGQYTIAAGTLVERKSATFTVLSDPKPNKHKGRVKLDGKKRWYKTTSGQSLKQLVHEIVLSEFSIIGEPIVAETEKPRAALTAATFATGARGRALLRGREHLETLLADAGGTFSQEQVQTILYGISRQAIDKRVREGSLLSVPGPNGARRYPVCQFLADGSLVKGMKEIQAALPVRGPWSAFLFLMQPHADLGGRTPLEVLKDGELAFVIAAAERLGAQGS